MLNFSKKIAHRSQIRQIKLFHLRINMLIEQSQIQSKLDQLKTVIKRLRDPENGCPWDIKQTKHSLIPCIIEECYELVEAINNNDQENLIEELGDVLLQVVFLADIGADAGQFDLEKVIDELIEKLVYRHPHVFAPAEQGLTIDKNLTATERAELALKNWNKQKDLRKKAKIGGSDISILDDIPQSFEPLMKAQKIQSKAAKQGFDWDDIKLVKAKILEELAELEAEMITADKELLEDEFGDLLFSCVNLARHLKINANQALIQANHKFEQRFRLVEKQCFDNKQEMAKTPLVELDIYWDQAKKILKNK